MSSFYVLSDVFIYLLLLTLKMFLHFSLGGKNGACKAAGKQHYQ